MYVVLNPEMIKKPAESCCSLKKNCNLPKSVAIEI
jgi:hypothetical protein